MRNEFAREIENDLFSDAMDSAVAVYCTVGSMNRNESGDGETKKRRQLAAAFRAFIENTPESDLVRLARPPAPYRDGTTVGPQAVARLSSPDPQ